MRAATTRSLSEMEQIADQLDRVINAIISNEPTQFKKDFCFH
jgi:hypothetical protein